ncbi:MAG TPA: hypothetical protein VJ654_10870 [Noviherbaspirillum sp.]|nr:hypothetical protein [Noviherbaspirillum sp.]
MWITIGDQEHLPDRVVVVGPLHGMHDGQQVFDGTRQMRFSNAWKARFDTCVYRLRARVQGVFHLSVGIVLQRPGVARPAEAWTVFVLGVPDCPDACDKWRRAARHDRISGVVTMLQASFPGQCRQAITHLRRTG